MKCTLCGHAFTPDEGHRACQACWLAKFCALVRCPNCGFEMPPDAKPASHDPLAHVPTPMAFIPTEVNLPVNAAKQSSKPKGVVTRLTGWLSNSCDVNKYEGCHAFEQSRSHGAPAAKIAPSAQAPTATSLAALEPGRKAVIAHIDTSRREGLRQLLALGLLPQTEITLLRRFPTLVIQMGHSQFAIDRELASLVFVCGQ